MLHTLTRSQQNSQTDSKRIGRGGKRGKTSGRGGKGQTARAGASMRPEMRDIIKRLPKLRGYKFNSIRVKPLGINLSKIDKNFDAGETVNPVTLYEKGLVSYKELRTLPVKVLSFGTLTKKLTFEGLEVSQKAKDAIIAASGIITE
ncbi:MAG TPA: 50S ribosomal protein L15 [Candidatus Paceibacterota bacterium]